MRLYDPGKDGRQWRHYRAPDQPVLRKADLRNVTQDTTSQWHTLGKPQGLWVTPGLEAGFSWPEWCKDEDFLPIGDYQRHIVAFEDGARLLVLDTPESLDLLTNVFGVDALPHIPGLDRRVIDWQAVEAAGYDGVLITPYHWQRRLAHMWYYGWDCASGVVWNMDAIMRIYSGRTLSEISSVYRDHAKAWRKTRSKRDGSETQAA
jgi:hypothetical protein